MRTNSASERICRTRIRTGDQFRQCERNPALGEISGTHSHAHLCHAVTLRAVAASFAQTSLAVASKAKFFDRIIADVLCDCRICSQPQRYSLTSPPKPQSAKPLPRLTSSSTPLQIRDRPFHSSLCDTAPRPLCRHPSRPSIRLSSYKRPLMRGARMGAASPVPLSRGPHRSPRMETLIPRIAVDVLASPASFPAWRRGASRGFVGSAADSCELLVQVGGERSGANRFLVRRKRRLYAFAEVNDPVFQIG